MFVSRVFSRISRNNLNQCRLFVSSRPESPSAFSNNIHSTLQFSNKVTSFSLFVQNRTGSQRFWTSSASPQPSNETALPEDGQETTGENNKKSTNVETTATKGDGKATEKMEDSDMEDELSIDDLVKLVAEKEELLKAKQKEIEQMQNKVLWSYAEMENIMDRTRREAENSKKFAIQNFAKSLLDVADNLGRASSVVKESFLKIDASKDTVGAVPLLKTLLEGVEMTEKQLAEVFRKFGVEKFDPLNEQFDPHRHLAVFQKPDGSKPPGTVAVVLKPGYILHDRILRPAEVGVTKAPNSETDQISNSETDKTCGA